MSKCLWDILLNEQHAQYVQRNLNLSFKLCRIGLLGGRYYHSFFSDDVMEGVHVNLRSSKHLSYNETCYFLLHWIKNYI
ncbi:hypothetical protein CR513_08387, partial [Mucuna pruriens]